MRYMIIVKATPDSEAGAMSDAALLDRMAAYHDALARAGVLLDAAGLQPSSNGWRVRFAGDTRTVIDGPFGEPKELVAGYTLVQVKNRDEAMEWARRFPNPAGDNGEAEIEVRRLFERDDVRQSGAVAHAKPANADGEASH